jgi:hypothetical protein
LLEEEVGVNPCIRVQRDDAFIPWDTLATKSVPGAGSIPNQPDARWKVEGAGSPEWMKRMVCCAKWEANAGDSEGKRVVFAVVDGKDSGAIGRQHEPLVDGELVRSWAAKLGLEVLEVEREKPAGSPGKGERRTRGGGGARTGGPPPGRGRGGRGGLVEKPAPAIMVPPAGKVIRVLARGEKLDPE